MSRAVLCVWCRIVACYLCFEHMCRYSVMCDTFQYQYYSDRSSLTTVHLSLFDWLVFSVCVGVSGGGMTALQQCHFEHEIHRLHSYFSMLRYQYKNTGQSVTGFDNLCIVVLAFSLLHDMPRV